MDYNIELEDDLKHILTYTPKVWKELADKTIFVTGGTGFFGKWFLESFLYANSILSLNAKIIVLSRDPKSFVVIHPCFQNENIHFIEGDVRDFNFPSIPIDYIIHAAADVDEPRQTFDSIVLGTRHILELARKKNVISILHTGSGAVYGQQPSEDIYIKEDSVSGMEAYDKIAGYAEGKRVAEILAARYYDLFAVKSKITRCFSFVGPYLRLDSHFAIGNFIKDILEDRPIVIKGDGTSVRSFLYASDLMVWLWNILIFGANCRPYNVGSDMFLTIKEIANVVSSFSENKNQKIEIIKRKPTNSPSMYVPDITRAKEELQLDVRVRFHEAVCKTIKFYSKF